MPYSIRKKAPKPATTANHQPAADGLATYQDVAKACQVSARTVETWAKKRLIPTIKVGPRCVRFNLPAVLQSLSRFEEQEVA